MPYVGIREPQKGSDPERRDVSLRAYKEGIYDASAPLLLQVRDESSANSRRGTWLAETIIKNVLADRMKGAWMSCV
jgi:hypothetical protein